MEKMQLGRTKLMVGRTGFGALPIQRASFDDASIILRKAFDNGISFFDTARAYSDSEEKIGLALSDVREQIVIATKSHASDKKTLFEHLQTSLDKLKTDYIDIYQLHNPKILPEPKDPESLYAGLLQAKQKGMIRFIGITNHSLQTAIQAAESGMYDTIQFPLNMLSSDEDLYLVELCRKLNIGVLAMKGMSGGLIRNACATFAFLRQYENILPLWGIQRMSELDEFLQYENNPPLLDETMKKLIELERTELAGDYCRGCGYCLPCRVGIDIPIAARISLLLGRAPLQQFITKDRKENMDLINQCVLCGDCMKRCPYGLDTPDLLRRELNKYMEVCKTYKLKD